MSVASTSQSAKRKRNDDEEDLCDSVLNADEVSVDEEQDEKVLDISSLTGLNKRNEKTGVVYISRIPPGMGPSKLKHILSQYGETDRVYLARDPRDERKQTKKRRNGKERHQAHRFVEGWIEFIDKKKAKATAELLNAKVIGGRPSDPFHEDIWTMKYLPKFKWNTLSAINAQVRAEEQALLRNEISQSKKAQANYLDQVERARVLRKAQDKKAGRVQPEIAQDSLSKVDKPKKQYRTFKQRPTVSPAERKSKDTSKQEALDNVLGSLFS